MQSQTPRKDEESKPAWKPTAVIKKGVSSVEKHSVLAGQGPQVRTANEHSAEAQIPIPVSEKAWNVQSSSYQKARGMLPYPLSSFRAIHDQLKSTGER